MILVFCFFFLFDLYTVFDSVDHSLPETPVFYPTYFNTQTSKKKKKTPLIRHSWTCLLPDGFLYLPRSRVCCCGLTIAGCVSEMAMPASVLVQPRAGEGRSQGNIFDPLQLPQPKTLSLDLDGPPG